MLNKKTANTEKNLQHLPTHDYITQHLWLSFREAPALSIYPQHDHAWAEFIYTFNGVMEINIEKIDYMIPPPYGLWLPAHTSHSGLNRTAVSHATLYIHESLTYHLPKEAGILLTSNLVSSVLLHLKQQPYAENAPEYLRLLHVLFDQLHHAEMIKNYLPHTEQPQLKAILDYLYQHPNDNSNLNILAQQQHMTERTLARYCQKELGMSLHEWRQRLKIIKAMSLLKNGDKVEHIAYELGYANASAFIAMFKRWMGTTPDQFRQYFD